MFSLDATLIRLSSLLYTHLIFYSSCRHVKHYPLPPCLSEGFSLPHPSPPFCPLTQSASAEAVVSPGRRLGLVAVQYLLHQLLHREAQSCCSHCCKSTWSHELPEGERRHSRQPTSQAFLPSPACALHPWPYLRARLHIKTTLSRKSVLQERESFFLVYCLTSDGNTESSRTDSGLLRGGTVQLMWEGKTLSINLPSSHFSWSKGPSPLTRCFLQFCALCCHHHFQAQPLSSEKKNNNNNWNGYKWQRKKETQQRKCADLWRGTVLEYQIASRYLKTAVHALLLQWA